ncbi:MAG: hypothetical protein IJR85_04700 [Synergistaceae bacterium]|nr:hypothetical protein [Synergistaceae bacterium]
MRIAPTIEELSQKIAASVEQDKKDWQKMRRFLIGCSLFSFSALTLSFVFSVWLLLQR